MRLYKISQYNTESFFNKIFITMVIKPLQFLAGSTYFSIASVYPIAVNASNRFKAIWIVMAKVVATYFRVVTNILKSPLITTIATIMLLISVGYEIYVSQDTKYDINNKLITISKKSEEENYSSPLRSSDKHILQISYIPEPVNPNNSMSQTS